MVESRRLFKASRILSRAAGCVRWPAIALAMLLLHAGCVQRTGASQQEADLAAPPFAPPSVAVFLDGPNMARVFPGTISVKRGTKVLFFKLDLDRVELKFPWDPSSPVIVDTDAAVEVRVPADSRRGRFDYEALCTKNGESFPGHGHSHPVMIVY